jgi:cephalosporin-C deacetylase-like acetyl esterase
MVYRISIHSSLSINRRPERSRSVYDRTSLICAPHMLLPDALIFMPQRTTPCPGAQYWCESVSIGMNAKHDSTQCYRHTYKGITLKSRLSWIVGLQPRRAWRALINYFGYSRQHQCKRLFFSFEISNHIFFLHDKGFDKWHTVCSLEAWNPGTDTHTGYPDVFQID